MNDYPPRIAWPASRRRLWRLSVADLRYVVTYNRLVALAYGGDAAPNADDVPDEITQHLLAIDATARGYVADVGDDEDEDESEDWQ